MNQTTLAKSAEHLRAKLQGSGLYQPISDEEYERLKVEQMTRLAERECQAFKLDYARMGLEEDEADLSWSAIKTGISDGVKARDAVKDAYKKGFGMVFLWGSWGQAKTLTGKILTATALRDGKSAAYANMSMVLDDIRLAFDEREHKTTELLRRMDWWIKRDVLFLDELDKANSTEWAQERIFQLLDQRYTRAIREDALTVVASNGSDKELDGYLKSRLNDRRLGPVVYLNGPDGRESMPDGYRY